MIFTRESHASDTGRAAARLIRSTTSQPATSREESASTPISQSGTAIKDHSSSRSSGHRPVTLIAGAFGLLRSGTGAVRERQPDARQG